MTSIIRLLAFLPAEVPEPKGELGVCIITFEVCELSSNLQNHNSFCLGITLRRTNYGLFQSMSLSAIFMHQVIYQLLISHNASIEDIKGS